MSEKRTSTFLDVLTNIHTGTSASLMHANPNSITILTEKRMSEKRTSTLDVPTNMHNGTLIMHSNPNSSTLKVMRETQPVLSMTGTAVLATERGHNSNQPTFTQTTIIYNMQNIILGKIQTMIVTTTDFGRYQEETTPANTELSCNSKCAVTKEPTKTKPNVSFASVVSVRYTISREHYTTEEKNAAWYTKQDFQDILKRCQKEINMMENGETLRDRKYCSRGLEGQTRLGAVARRQNKLLVWKQVLAAQYYQGKGSDGEKIAKVCEQVTASAQLWARRVGLLDHQAVEKFLEKCSEKWHREDIGSVHKEETLKLSSLKQETKEHKGSTFKESNWKMNNPKQDTFEGPKWNQLGHIKQRIIASRQA